MRGIFFYQKILLITFTVGFASFIQANEEGNKKRYKGLLKRASQQINSQEYKSLTQFLTNKGSKVHTFQNDKFYGGFQKSMTRSWKSFQAPNLKKMSSWKNKELKEICLKKKNTVLYPFSGPDISNALAIFPNAKKYILIGLEPPGNLPPISTLNDNEIREQLKKLKKSLEIILQINFFRTKGMEVNLEKRSVNSISGILTFFLAMNGLRPESYKRIVLNSHSEIGTDHFPDVGVDPFKPTHPFFIPGVEIKFRGKNGEKKVLQYFSLNIADEYLEKYSRHFLEYLNKSKDYLTILKSASYLLHNYLPAKFSRIRSLLLGHSDFIIQDDSGIPYKFFKERNWEVGHHGIYDGPIKLFRERFQSDLKKAFDQRSTGPLPFTYGYGKNSLRGSNLLTAYKKEKLKKCLKK